jgi:uncharacterized protein
MYRKSQDSLKAWKDRSSRKPLILRGARQVGKTFQVRQLAENFSNFIEINFDKTPDKKLLFKDADIKKVIQLISVDCGSIITPGKTLLFLDEIQAAPEIFAKLRYFYEDLPELHVIAAGSLLDFILEEHVFSMPVGRVEYLYLGPMSFEEFLIARDESILVDYYERYAINDEIPLSIHEKSMNQIKEFCIVGGMPAAVKTFCSDRDLDIVHREHQSIHQSYQNDFSKYGHRINTQRLEKVYRSLPALIGKKMKYAAIDPEERAKPLAESIHMLEKARVINKVYHSSSNGVPLAAERNEKNFKPIFLDIGLLNSALGLKLSALHLCNDLVTVHGGSMCEQLVGQQLLYAKEDYYEPEIHYWNREKKNAAAEVDYVISRDQDIIPVEVKAGKTGRLKSLQQFIVEKKPSVALRINSDTPSLVTIEKEGHSCELYSLPFYLTEQQGRLLTK